MVHLTRQAVFQSFFGNSICRWLPRLACSPHVPAFLYLSAGMRAPLAVGFTALGDGGFHRFDTGKVGAHCQGSATFDSSTRTTRSAHSGELM